MDYKTVFTKNKIKKGGIKWFFDIVKQILKNADGVYFKSVF